MLLMIEKPRSTPAERAARALARVARAVPSAVDAVIMGPFRAWDARRLVDALAALSDRDLRDIGLNRGDIRDAVLRRPRGDARSFLAGRRHGG